MGSADAEVPLTAEIVGNAFVQQYYHLLHHSPEIGYRFYSDNSVMCRPNHEGNMTVATTMNGINDVICSFNYKNYEAEIDTVDTQSSFHNGVFILVTGSLTGNGHQKRKFMQTFFLAPQVTGYYILNDIFRYLNDKIPEAVSEVWFGPDGTYSNNLHHGSEPAGVVETPQSDLPKAPVNKIATAEEKGNVEETINGQMISVEPHELSQYDPPNAPVKEVEAVEENRNGEMISVGPPFPEKDTVVEAKPHSNGNNVPVDSEAVITVSDEDPPKKSYAWVVSSQKKRAPAKVYVPATIQREAAAKVVTPSVTQPSEVPSGVSLHKKPVTASENNINPDKENNNIPDQDEGHTIYVGYLPPNATPSLLKEAFEKFGPIKPSGIQVRRNWQQGFCFGFVEFQELRSMQSAIKASHIMIGDRQAVVEAKRSTSRVGTGRNHLVSGQGGFRDKNLGGQGNFGRRQVYMRTNNGNSGGARACHQGRGRDGHQTGPSRNLIPAQS